MAIFFTFVLAGFLEFNYLGYSISFVTGVNLSLVFMVVSFFLRPKPTYKQDKRDRTWVVAAFGFLCVIVAISYATSLAKTHPMFFWPVYFLLALSMLGCMAHAYEPKEHYYLSWAAGASSFEYGTDRDHIALGFATALAGLITESYSDILGSTWLWRGLDRRELSGAVELLQALAAKDSRRATACTRRLGKASALRVVRALVKLDMIIIHEGHPYLSLKGREFLPKKLRRMVEV